MKRLVLLNAALITASLGCALGGYLTMDKEAWLAATAFGVGAVVSGAVLLIAALIERRYGVALAGLGFGIFGFVAAYFELLVGAVTASATGRPLRVRGRIRARSEHASIPAFARISYQLWAHGAPPELIERAHRAALDEIKHARLCGEPFVALPCGALDVGTLQSIAIESLVDGVIAEGHAAEEAAQRTGEPWETIARDEREHATLARDIYDWCTRDQRRSSGL